MLLKFLRVLPQDNFHLRMSSSWYSICSFPFCCNFMVLSWYDFVSTAMKCSMFFGLSGMKVQSAMLLQQVQF